MKNFKWDKQYLYWGVTAFSVVVASIVFFWVLNSLADIREIIGLMTSALTPIIYGLLIAYLLNKIMVVLERHLFLPLSGRLFAGKPKLIPKAARIFSIIVTLLLALGFISGLLAIVLPEIANSVMKIISNSEGYLNSAIDWLEKAFDGYALEPVAIEWLNTISERVVNWLETSVLPQITTLITSITGGVISVVSTIVNFFVGIIISVYLMYNKETFCAQAKKVLYGVLRPRPANVLLSELDFVNDAFGDYIVGTLIDALIVGVINYLFMTILGMPYTALVTIIVAVTNLIPVFGPVIGAVPSALLLLLENPTQALIFLIFTVVLQQIDGQIIKPRIHASRSGLSGFWIMFAILFFGGLFGILGMVIGVPVTTVLYNLFRRLDNRLLRRRKLPTQTDFYRGLTAIDPDSREPSYRGDQTPAPTEGPEAPEAAPETPETSTTPEVPAEPGTAGDTDKEETHGPTV